MRYPKELYMDLKAAVAAITTKEIVQATRENVAQIYNAKKQETGWIGDVEKGLRWCIMHNITDHYDLYINPAYKQGCNDDHLDTALRSIMKELGYV